MGVEDAEPNLVTSGRSSHIEIDGYGFSVEIYRLETELEWTLEVVDADGTSHVWDDRFSSDKDALEEAVRVLKAEGARRFMRGNNIIPFRK